MYNTDIYIDHIFSDDDLANGFGRAHAMAAKHVAVVDEKDYEALGNAWARPSVRMLLCTSRMRGDFPGAIALWLREDAPDLQRLLQGAAQTLQASILTDELVVNPLFTSEWLMFTPDGDAVVIETDDAAFGADDPAIILTPESRADYQAHQPHSGRFATTA